MSITYYDPEDDDGGAATADAPTRTPARERTVGWKLLAGGFVGYLAIQLLQAAQFQLSDSWLHALIGAGFVVTTSLVTAGIIVISLRRWVLPELARSVASETAREIAGPDDGPPRP